MLGVHLMSAPRIGDPPPPVATYMQPLAPIPPIPLGSVWINTDKGNVVMRWDGLEWIAAPIDTTLTFAQATPPVAVNVGDLWIDTSIGNVVNRWDGSAWVVTQFGRGSITADAISAFTITAMSIVAGTLSAGVIGASSILNSELDDCDIVVDSNGGTILVYGVTGQTVTTITAAGAGVFDVPADVYSARVECWGAGGGGRQNELAPDFLGYLYGGAGGTGGGYACEPNYPLTPLAAIDYSVGAGGAGGVSLGDDGKAGSDTVFDGAVIAHGGPGTSGRTPVPGGHRSLNSLHFPGGQNAVPIVENWAPDSCSGASGAGISQAGTPGNPAPPDGPAPLAIAPLGGGDGGASAKFAPGGPGGAPGGGGGGGGGGGAPQPGGPGGDGQLRLTYGGTRVLLLSIAGAAGTDKYGINYPAGFLNTQESAQGSPLLGAAYNPGKPILHARARLIGTSDAVDGLTSLVVLPDATSILACTSGMNMLAGYSVISRPDLSSLVAGLCFQLCSPDTPYAGLVSQDYDFNVDISYQA